MLVPQRNNLQDMTRLLSLGRSSHRQRHLSDFVNFCTAQNKVMHHVVLCSKNQHHCTEFFRHSAAICKSAQMSPFYALTFLAGMQPVIVREKCFLLACRFAQKPRRQSRNLQQLQNQCHQLHHQSLLSAYLLADLGVGAAAVLGTPEGLVLIGGSTILLLRVIAESSQLLSDLYSKLPRLDLELYPASLPS